MLLPKLNCKNNIENVILTFISISHVFFPIMLFHMLSAEGLHFSAFHYMFSYVFLCPTQSGICLCMYCVVCEQVVSMRVFTIISDDTLMQQRQNKFETLQSSMREIVYAVHF